MISIVLALAVGMSLALFGYKLVRLFAPFVFFVLGVIGVYQWVDARTESAAILWSCSVLGGMVLGVILATFSSVIISLGAALLVATVVFRLLTLGFLHNLGVPDFLAGFLAVVIIGIFLLVAVGTYLMRYIGIVIASVLGSVMVYAAFAAMVNEDSILAFAALTPVEPFLAGAASVICLAGIVMQLQQHRASQRPMSEQGLWSLQDFRLPDSIIKKSAS